MYVAEPKSATVRDPLVVGVAISVPPPWGEQLAQVRTRFTDSTASAVTPHITVLAPTPVPAWQLDSVQAHLARVAQDCPAFDVRLRGTATFRPVSPVVFLSVVEGISECERLERLVRSGVLLRRRPFPFHPHVTVAHDVSDELLDEAYVSLDDFSARFRAESFTLSSQDESGCWTVLADYPLRGASLGPARNRRD